MYSKSRLYDKDRLVTIQVYDFWKILIEASRRYLLDIVIHSAEVDKLRRAVKNVM